MERFEVVIVGGGPAGSTCAGRLHASGLRVLVLDRKTFPRDKICAGWVTPPVFDCLGIDIDAYRSQHVCQPITGFRTGLIGAREVETRYDHAVSFGIRRCEFDHFLLQRSEAPTRLGTSLENFERIKGGWRINDDIETSLLVGAGGNFCPVARSLRMTEENHTTVVAAQEVEFELSASARAEVTVDPEIPELFFCEDLAGYGWCFRKGEFLNIGLGRADSSHLSEHVSDFVEFLRSRGKVACNIPGRFHGHAYRLYESANSKLLDDGVLLIGDAAGLADPQSGEGIRPAVESGLLAADVILDANGDYRADRLAAYARDLRARFGEPRRRSGSGFLPQSWLRFVAGRLLANRWFSRRVVLDRWFLHASQQPLNMGNSVQR